MLQLLLLLTLFLAPDSLYPDNRGDTFLRNVGSYKNPRRQIRENAIPHCYGLFTATAVVWWSEIVATDSEAPGSILGAVRF
jgi:hypothetical protein